MLLQFPVHQPGQFVLAELLVRALGADHYPDYSGLSAQQFAVECPMQERAVESHHRRRQPDASGITQVDRVNRLVAEALDDFSDFGQRRDPDQKRVDLMWRQRTNYVAEHFLPATHAHAESRVARIDGSDAASDAHCSPPRFDVRSRRLGKQGGQIGFGQEQITVVARRAQAVAQHPEKNAAGSLVGRRIECRHAQRMPQHAAQSRALSEAVKQFIHRHVPGESIVAQPHAYDETQCA